MPANRHNLTVDEQFFQELLSAAYTIQEHNDRLEDNRLEDDPLSHAPANTRSAPVEEPPQPTIVCEQCGASRSASQPQCEHCAQDELRPGERMQRKWASMWLLSQQQGLWPAHPSGEQETQKEASALDLRRAPRSTAEHDFAASGILSSPPDIDLDEEAATSDTIRKIDELIRHDEANGGATNGHNGNGKTALPGPELTGFEFDEAPLANHWTEPALENKAESKIEAGAVDDCPSEKSFSQQAVAAAETGDLAAPALHRAASDELALPEDGLSVHDSGSDNDNDNAYDYADENAEEQIAVGDAAPVSLFQRIADWRVKLRFHRADVYLGVAIVVAAFALLWPTAGSSSQPSLSAWDRALITLGIAEAAPPAIHVQGDPAIEVWVDPHTALYYCPGDEQYGKTTDGRFTSQREAQMDRFEAAGGSACGD